MGRRFHWCRSSDLNRGPADREFAVPCQTVFLCFACPCRDEAPLRNPSRAGRLPIERESAEELRKGGTMPRWVWLLVLLCIAIPASAQEVVKIGQIEAQT